MGGFIEAIDALADSGSKPKMMSQTAFLLGAIALLGLLYEVLWLARID
jgi:hypothetical protein